MRDVCQVIAVGLVVGGVLGIGSSARAAEFTDLLDAADDKGDYDEDTYDPFDFHFEPSFEFNTSKGTISREAPCVPKQQGEAANDTIANNPRVQFNPGRCSEATIVDNKEMIYRHQRGELDLDFRFGLYKDLELRFNVPFVLFDRYGLKYANESDNPANHVTPENSYVDPTDEKIAENAEQVFGGSGSRSSKLNRLSRFKQHRFFDLQGSFRDYSRSGFTDPTVGLHWAPYNDQRDDTKATLALGMDYTMPVAPVRKADNDDVGEGLHKFAWSFRTSKKFDWIDPYFGLEYQLPLLSSQSPIHELKNTKGRNGGPNVGQTVTNPPHRADVTIGTEFVPYEDEANGEKYVIDLRFNFGYTSEGRDYTPLYEHMTNSKCNGKTADEILPQFDEQGNLQNPDGVGCSWIAQRPANVRPSPKYSLSGEDNSRSPGLSNNDSFRTNGIMTVEGYATFGGQLGFYLQPTEYFELKAIFGLEHQQSHLLTNARTGKDAEDRLENSPDGKVDLTGNDADLERNPAYNSTYDSPGTRFRLNGFNTWTIQLVTALQF